MLLRDIIHSVQNKFLVKNYYGRLKVSVEYFPDCNPTSLFSLSVCWTGSLMAAACCRPVVCAVMSHAAGLIPH